MTLSCASVTKHNAGKDAATARESADAQLAALDKQLLWPVCDIPAKPGACGLEADRWLEDASTDKFIREKCGGTLDDSCKDRFFAAMIDAVKARANRAKEQDVIGYCKTHAGECPTIRHIELLYMRAHNEDVFAAQRRIEERAQKTQQEIEQRAKLQAEAFSAIGEGLKAGAEAYARPNSVQTKTNCSVYGNQANCTSTTRY